ncbi:hypothetical protein ACIGZJ_06230 [Kitasatospora sp. NPDC052868]|uniref:hypothetical protein n=1 Tax=Kitasatospora sp. NPDC052868 TaxID=3364060 RepID=UPI0037C82803
MVKAILNLVDATFSRGLKEEAADAQCACPAGTSSWCSGSTLFVRTCCSWNCAVAPSCDVYAITNAC